MWRIKERKSKKGASAWDRTKDLSVNSRSLCLLSHGSFLNGSTGEGIRERVREERKIGDKKLKDKRDVYGCRYDRMCGCLDV